MNGEQAGAVVVAILQQYGVSVSRETVLNEFTKRTGVHGYETGHYLPETYLRRGLQWARKRGFVITTSRHHRGERVYWRYCGGES